MFIGERDHFKNDHKHGRQNAKIIDILNNRIEMIGGYTAISGMYETKVFI